MNRQRISKNTKVVLFLFLVAVSHKETWAQSADFKTYSKFDFVSGEKVGGLRRFFTNGYWRFPGKVEHQRQW